MFKKLQNNDIHYYEAALAKPEHTPVMTARLAVDVDEGEIQRCHPERNGKHVEPEEVDGYIHETKRKMRQAHSNKTGEWLSPIDFIVLKATHTLTGVFTKLYLQHKTSRQRMRRLTTKRKCYKRPKSLWAS